ncbi:hypothetical protein [Arthrobacter sp. Leaf141]|uniref:hypothetical protein n=1 Tax=Arthrobacter sp. Leaf141 TaxID=1736273 RepID=UPI000B0CFA9A|nr:hypothetical protein [Arthrobacter sp. Leaf141]
MSEYATPKVFVRYIGDDGEEWDAEYSEFAPVTGRFVFHGTQGYRVAEVWDIQAKHGAVEYGLTAFVDAVDVMEHRLGQHAPSYYRG